MTSAFDESGFVLVGVVIMVLALTILGLSLFGLSSYEAQFMDRSLDETQALESAMGGIDRARFTLGVAPDSLASVTYHLPYENVTYARAMQKKGSVYDSLGVLIPGGNDIELKVTASYRGVTRTVTGMYKSDAQINCYNRLATLSDGITVISLSGPGAGTDRKFSVVMRDSIWENNPNFNALTLYGGSPLPSVRIGGVPSPAPDVGLFITGHKSGPPTPLNVTNTSNDLQLLGTPGQIDYWVVPPPLQDPNYTLRVQLGSPTIHVRGKAVLLLPKGVRYDVGVDILQSSDPNACLVIVAQQGNDLTGMPLWNDPAIWFFNSIRICQIPVILVTDATVAIEQFGGTGNSGVDRLSVYANRLFVTGPILPDKMSLTYNPAVMDTLISTLMASNALPRSFTNTPYALHPDTWHVVP